jgi:triosephosphate isomerase
MRQKLIAGNWKMNGSLAENQTRLTQLVSGLKAVAAQVAVSAPAPYLAQCRSSLAASDIQWGSQNVSEYKQGAYTGEISCSMLQDFGCTFALVGHSERRELFAESNQQVANKFSAIIEAGLVPVLCVGETLEHRESGSTERVISEQIQAVLNQVGIKGFENAVVAYEPIWAIGTGKTASPEQAQEVHSAIRTQLNELDSEIAQKIQILYGGSVKPSNAAAIFTQVDVDGALVGGAALNAQDFIEICNAAS